MDRVDISTTTSQALAIKELVEHFSKLSSTMRKILERRAGLPNLNGADKPPKSI